MNFIPHCLILLLAPVAALGYLFIFVKYAFLTGIVTAEERLFKMVKK